MEYHSADCLLLMFVPNLHNSGLSTPVWRSKPGYRTELSALVRPLGREECPLRTMFSKGRSNAVISCPDSAMFRGEVGGHSMPNSLLARCGSPQNCCVLIKHYGIEQTAESISIANNELVPDEMLGGSWES
ncbi:hypothetical protein SKAU_G00124150 [Synaphobranchus kaupii]|uniref:Uncharacterized protein n=1 Tax=Synaphobranchus kaupii TaxID=118154 RepID=A0A9Q1FPI2_SYNKA|nr:hypothetical protein SKAU_G00124150 [Synaphobranchus kaupii]